jgi:hypothetical protein
MSNKTGGPAFPTGTAFQGMTLRDFFAAKAMQALCSRSESDNWTTDEVAIDAYSYADSMLKAREQ